MVMLVVSAPVGVMLLDPLWIVFAPPARVVPFVMLVIVAHTGWMSLSAGDDG